ncbi:hypothetical protein LguiB_018031 [Lonicera macranthoides]
MDEQLVPGRPVIDVLPDPHSRGSPLYERGSIPESFGKLISLELLDISNNNLSGPIPKSLEGLRYLQYFNVSFNKLQGEIPTGGHFAKFTPQSFMQNDGLCGVPPLQVQPCKISWSRNLSSLKYMLTPIITTILLVALIFVFIRGLKRGSESHTQLSSLPYAWRRISYIELFQATNGFNESNLLGVGGVRSVYKGTLSGEVNVVVKVFKFAIRRRIYEEGIISTKGDVYSYGVILIETFTRKKPTDEMFFDEMTMRSWVCEASLGSIVQVVDANLIGMEDVTFVLRLFNKFSYKEAQHGRCCG